MREKSSDLIFVLFFSVVVGNFCVKVDLFHSLNLFSEFAKFDFLKNETETFENF